MRRGVWLLVLGALAAAFAAASAQAGGTTTTPTTTTTGTTTAAPPGFTRLPPSYLPAGCVGAGEVAIAEPGRRVLALGTPASGTGASGYPATAPVVTFASSTASGSTCRSARVTLGSVSLFGGFVTATSVEATHGKGTVTGLAVGGSPVTLEAGESTLLGLWGQLTLGRTVGRLTAPLVVILYRQHDSLPAGTTLVVAYTASAQLVGKRKATHGSSARGRPAGTTSTVPAPATKKHRHKKHKPEPLTARPSLGYKPSHYVFPVDGGASYVDTYGANRNDIYDGWHHGDDLFAPLGTPVVAVARGTLSLVGWNRLGGWRLWLTDTKGNSFYYAHLAGYARWILTHHHVRAGQVVGFLGRTGDAFTTTPHLHFEIHPHQPAYVKLGYDGAVDPTTYLHKWRIEHVPADEIPQPAKLKAPVGIPTQEAAVVWHQLLVARHLVGVTSTSSTAVTRRPFPHPLSLEASGVAPLQLATVRPTAARASASQGNVPLLVGGPLGGVLALSAVAGAFTFRRRRRTAAADEPSS
jgi:murein DD-endopeptidase MepM/ murein hydrolase activator NlpD